MNSGVTLFHFRPKVIEISVRYIKLENILISIDAKFSKNMCLFFFKSTKFCLKLKRSVKTYDIKYKYNIILFVNLNKNDKSYRYLQK